MTNSLRPFIVIGLALALLTSDSAIVEAQQADDEEQSPLLKEPETPEELFHAVDLMMRLARPGLARRYLEKLMAANPDDATLIRIRDKHGPAVFLQLADVDELKPLSVQLLEQVSEAFRRQGASPERLDALIADLRKSAQEREVALIALRSAGAVAVPRILQHLNDPAQQQQHDLLLYTLTRLGRPVIPPLLGALDTPNENLRATVIEALGFLATPQEAYYLWYPAFAPNQPDGVRQAARQALARIHDLSNVDRVTSYGVATKLKQTALEHFSHKYKWDVEDTGGQVPIWSWSDQAQTVGVSIVSPQSASLYVGTRLAKQALEISPERPDLQALFVSLLLASERYRVGSDKPLPTGPGTAHNLALTSGADVATEALRLALDQGNAAAARALLQVLAQIGTRHPLYGQDARVSPLISALNYPDSWVQFAAAETIMQLDPHKPFRGSRRVVEILTRALNDDAAARAVVVDADTARASQFAGLLGQLGYDPLIANTGNEGFRIAAERMDVELILLEINVARLPLSQTIANLRADARTASIPIVIYGDEEMRSRVEWRLARDPLLAYAIPSTTSDHLATQIQPFLDGLQSETPTPEQRAAIHASAVFWMLHIANGKRTDVFDITTAEGALFAAVNIPELARDALSALGAIATPTVQTRFHEVIMNDNVDVRIRETAALQLAFHIQRFGLMIDDQQAAQLTALWRSTQDRALATALASVVGSLKPNAALVNAELGQFPLPSAPAP